MYIKLTSIFLLLAILLCFASCSKNNEDGQKLKYYTINNEDSVCVELIQKYNNYCLKNLDESYQIEIVEFDSDFSHTRQGSMFGFLYHSTYYGILKDVFQKLQTENPPPEKS